MMGDAWTFLAGLPNSTASARLYAAMIYLAALHFAQTLLSSSYYVLGAQRLLHPGIVHRSSVKRIAAPGQLTTAVLDVGKFATVPASSQDIFTVSSFTDASDGAEYCIISEAYANSDNYYVNGRGLFVNASLGIHLASPHPIFGFDTPDRLLH
ncbi:hypothetical protein BDZ89DRAFT_1066673 [Hymenopellis radicata]|nr:hypothetical protein BDZ89DRAFT_1066673 [Hymenopellis radicata]